MRYTLRQLAVFIACARYENMTKAADSLAMSQSAASSAIKELERQFDLPLFDRVGKRLQLNDSGTWLLPKARALITQAQELELRLLDPPVLGHLNVGATLTIGNYVAVDIMARYMDQYPGSRIELDVANTHTIVDKLSRFELDIGLVEGEVNHASLIVEPWCDDELVVFASPAHPLASMEVVGDEDLLSVDWVLREPGSGTRQQFEKGMSGLLGQLNIKLQLQHTEAIKRAVAANLGVGCLSKMALVDSLTKGEVVALPLASRRFHRQFYFVWHKQKFLSASINHWLALCRAMNTERGGVQSLA